MIVKELNSFEEIMPYRSIWLELLEKTPNANFFQSLDWLEVYWKHYGSEQQLRILLVEASGEVIGIVPLVVRQEATKVGILRFATYQMDYWGSFYGPIGADVDAILSAAIDYLQSIPSDWDVLELRWLGADDGECGQAEALLYAAGHAPVRGEYDSTAMIKLGCSWEEYLSSRGNKWRNNARRWQRQLEKHGEVTYFRFRPDEGSSDAEVWENFDECLRLASLSWQGSSTTGTTLSHESVADFLRDVHAAAARCGCLDLNLLRLNGKAIAFAYNYVFNGNVFGLRSGFDPNCPAKGAGSLLCSKIIEDSFRRGDWQYDLGPRHLESKRKLLTHVMPVYRLSCFKRWSVRQQLVRLKRTLDYKLLPTATSHDPLPLVVHSDS